MVVLFGNERYTIDIGGVIKIDCQTLDHLHVTCIVVDNKVDLDLAKHEPVKRVVRCVAIVVAGRR